METRMTAPAKPEPNVGELATGDDRRDAIHVAVVSVTATVRVHPGQAVGVDGNHSDTPVGIVDPFLKVAVFPGERFWLFLYPRTVTSLRHVWSHPAFADEKPASKSDTSASEKWLMDYAMRLNNYDEPDEAYRHLLDGLRSGKLRVHGMSSVYCLNDLDDADELRQHAEAVLGIRIDWDNYTFSCSC